MSEESQRLSKVVAALVPCSRSQAEQYIAEGWVRVDGKRVEEPQFRVTPQQRVEVERDARLQPALSVTVLVHKPSGMSTAEAQARIGAASHWDGDASGIRRTKGTPWAWSPCCRCRTRRAAWRCSARTGASFASSRKMQR